VKAACIAVAAMPTDVRVAVNVSPRQLTADLPHRVHRIVNETGLLPHRLQLELTESQRIVVTSKVTDTLEKCRSMGVSLALDNFGSRLSNPELLWQLPFDRLKVDPSVFRVTVERSNGLELLQALIALPIELSLSPTANGVETEDQREIAAAAGFEDLQGFLFSKPIAANELVEYAANASRQRAAIEPPRNLRLSSSKAFLSRQETNWVN
jgi:EAL domain-containing protein (putative c-di-GMP-specific phosphodiesterase class I)